MAGNGQKHPKDSEIPIKKWLEQIGATEIEFVGGDSKGGPPDYVITYKGERVAVEVSLLHESRGWDRETEHSFERELKQLIEEEAKKGGGKLRWYSSCEYDPQQPQTSISDREIWKKNACKALNVPGMGGEFQLLPDEKVVGRGVVLILIPAGNEGCFSGIAVDEGCIVAQTLAEQVASNVKKKSGKVQRGERSQEYDRWWLVFDDEVLITPVGALMVSERIEVERKIRECEGREQWSKIITVSRFQVNEAPPESSKWFHALWEDPCHPSLSSRA